MSPQDNSLDLTTIVYRLNALEIQIQHFDEKVQQWHDEFKLYVSIRENDLRTQAMKTTAERIEGEITETQNALILNKKEFGDIRDSIYAIKTAQDKAQIRILLTAVSAIITIASGVLIGLFSHLIQP